MHFSYSSSLISSVRLLLTITFLFVRLGLTSLSPSVDVIQNVMKLHMVFILSFSGMVILSLMTNTESSLNISTLLILAYVPRLLMCAFDLKFFSIVLMAFSIFSGNLMSCVVFSLICSDTLLADL